MHSSIHFADHEGGVLVDVITHVFHSLHAGGAHLHLAIGLFLRGRVCSVPAGDSLIPIKVRPQQPHFDPRVEVPDRAGGTDHLASRILVVVELVCLFPVVAGGLVP